VVMSRLEWMLVDVADMDDEVAYLRSMLLFWIEALLGLLLCLPL
jgi:hypothetical protein